MINETQPQATMTTESTSDRRCKIELPPGGVSLAEVEKELVRQAMERAVGNQTHAAELLGIERDALRRRLIKFGLLHTPSQPVNRTNVA